MDTIKYIHAQIDKLILVQCFNAWLNLIYMNGDEAAQIKTTELNVRHNISQKSSSTHTRVDINDLLSKVRDNERKQKKENLVFFGLVASVVAITGIIASL